MTAPATPGISIQRGHDLLAWQEDLARLRIQVFREFPYLYEGSLDYERDYLAGFAAAEGAVLVLALDGERVVGCATAMAMAGAEAAFRQPFEQAGMAIDSIVYFGESVLLPDYRGLGVGHRFFDEREREAHRLGARLTTFCAVQRPDDHPLRPANYRSLHPFWHKRGYRQRPELTTRFRWQDVDESAESAKTMVFWTRESTTG
ncbi:MAG: GNAT family N-acetyltransferase [Wenzhouxiangella sp.]